MKCLRLHCLGSTLIHPARHCIDRQVSQRFHEKQKKKKYRAMRPTEPKKRVQQPRQQVVGALRRLPLFGMHISAGGASPTFRNAHNGKLINAEDGPTAILLVSVAVSGCRIHRLQRSLRLRVFVVNFVSSMFYRFRRRRRSSASAPRASSMNDAGSGMVMVIVPSMYRLLVSQAM